MPGFLPASLTWIKTSPAECYAYSASMGRHIVFKCPQTGLNVQHWLAAALDERVGTHSPVVCKACTKLHFINRETGKLLGEPVRGRWPAGRRAGASQ